MERILISTIIVLATWIALLLAAKAPAAPAQVDCVRNPIYCAITKLRPDIDRDLAMELSNHISKYSKAYGTDPLRTVAIAMQESTLKNIHRKQAVVTVTEECSETPPSHQSCVEYSKVTWGYTDIGIYQFHAATIQAYGMDALRLRDDLAYATEQHCFLLAVKMRECAGLGQESWSCYHSATESYRTKYVRMVNRYYERIAK